MDKKKYGKFVDKEKRHKKSWLVKIVKYSNFLDKKNWEHTVISLCTEQTQ